MNSLILRTSSRHILPITLAFSIYVLLRGHNEPGGGFIGGLIAAAGFTVYALPRGRDTLMTILRIPPKTLIGLGISMALLSGLPALALLRPFLTHQWASTALGLGTTLVFDVGVYLAVIGAVVTLLSYYLEN